MRVCAERVPLLFLWLGSSRSYPSLCILFLLSIRCTPFEWFVSWNPKYSLDFYCIFYDEAVWFPIDSMRVVLVCCLLSVCRLFVINPIDSVVGAEWRLSLFHCRASSVSVEDLYPPSFLKFFECPPLLYAPYDCHRKPLPFLSAPCTFFIVFAPWFRMRTAIAIPWLLGWLRVRELTPCAMCVHCSRQSVFRKWPIN